MAGAKHQPLAKLAGPVGASGIKVEAPRTEHPSAEEDFHAWLVQQAEAVRGRQFDRVDWENLAEELDSMARAERRELRSRLATLLAHLLKWRYQVKRRSRSWEGTIARERIEIEDTLSEEPSLRSYLNEAVEKAYRLARPSAGREMGLSKTQWEALFPSECPWQFDEMLNEDFWPEIAEIRSRPAPRKQPGRS